MGLGGISIWQLLIILVIVVLIFGTKKLKNMGGDIGGAVKNFKTAMKDEEKEAAELEEGETEAGEEIASDSAKEEVKEEEKKTS